MALTAEDQSTHAHPTTQQPVSSDMTTNQLKTNQLKTSRFAILCWSILGYNILVVLWGAFVRATGSGAGCGDHWPLCNGEIMPHSPRIDTIIELTHRLSTGLLGLLVLWMVIWAFRLHVQDVAQKRAIRRAALWTLFFILTESAIGAGLVKFEWVATNVSIERVYTIAFHLINTFLLLAANTLVAWFALGGKPFSVRSSTWGGAAGKSTGGKLLGALALSTAGLLLLGASGAITALGDTLYYTAGITPEESPLVARLVSLRIYHPLIAFGVLGLLWWTLQMILAPSTRRNGFSSLTHRFAWAMLGIYLVQLVGGAVNVYLKAPIWMQIIHLLLSDLIWILIVLTAASALAQADDVSGGDGSEAEVDLPAYSSTA